MTSLASSLPAPVRRSKWETLSDSEEQKPKIEKTKKKRKDVVVEIPPYPFRQKFVPKTVKVIAICLFKDFGDGGAFPEIKVVQYPLDMGRTSTVSNSKTLPLQIEEDGKIRYDRVLDPTGKALIKSRLGDVTETSAKLSLERPSEEIINETTEKTRAALEKIVQGKIAASQPKQLVKEDKKEGPTYIKYTPQQKETQGDGENTGTRIVRMAYKQEDPMEPPKFRNRKQPRDPGSPPAPVLHSPPRRVTAEEQAAWVIPPCISNWKNSKGYTIPLDKRLAADGRGLQDVQINDNFAKLAEALYVADRHAREEVRLRAEMMNKLAAKEMKEKEERLRLLAQRARESRSGVLDNERDERRQSSDESDRGKGRRSRSRDSESSEDEYGRDRPSTRRSVEPKRARDDDEDEDYKERERIRRERLKMHEREVRLSQARLGDRDVSEKVALGVQQPTKSKESMFDTRLFNQSSGMDSGFKEEDMYAIYDKPLFSGATSAHVYRPKRTVGDEEYREMDKLIDSMPHKGFQGTEGGVSVERSGPVQFEKHVDEADEEEGDVFGVEEFLETAKKGKDRRD